MVRLNFPILLYGLLRFSRGGGACKKGSLEPLGALLGALGGPLGALEAPRGHQGLLIENSRAKIESDAPNASHRHFEIKSRQMPSAMERVEGDFFGSHAHL